MDISGVTQIVAGVIYVVLALIALWGAFCVVMVWMRVSQKRFRSEEAQEEFLAELDEPFEQGDFDTAGELCQGDPRAVPQLALLAVQSRDIGYSKVRKLLVDHFQRDVLADLEYRLSWVTTVIKAAPMVGLLGTVMGMVGAFAKLESESKVDASQMAGDISLALYTTACGLAIAIPLVFCTASVNVRIRKMEDLVSVGLNRFFESFRVALNHPAAKPAGRPSRKTKPITKEPAED